MVITPSVGCIVMCGVNAAGNNGTDVAPAVITRVWSNEMVNVKVFNDGLACEWKTSVHLFDVEEQAREYGILSACYWPPRV
jgi:hypothetical protein